MFWLETRAQERIAGAEGGRQDGARGVQGLMRQSQAGKSGRRVQGARVRVSRLGWFLFGAWDLRKQDALVCGPTERRKQKIWKSLTFSNQ